MFCRAVSFYYCLSLLRVCCFCGVFVFAAAGDFMSSKMQYVNNDILTDCVLAKDFKVCSHRHTQPHTFNKDFKGACNSSGVCVCVCVSVCV